MFRIATILIVLSVAGSEVNCGPWLKGFNCFSSGCTSEDVAPGTSKPSALNPAIESSAAGSGPPMSKSAPPSSLVDTKIGNEFELPEQKPKDLGKITVDIDVLSGSCKEIDKYKRDQDHWKHVQSCLKEIVNNIEAYKSSCIDNNILDAFKILTVFDSVHDDAETTTFEKSFSFILPDNPFRFNPDREKNFEAHCLKGKLDIKYPHWWLLQRFVSEIKGLGTKYENKKTGEKYYEQEYANIEMMKLFTISCDLIEGDEPLKKLLVAGGQFLEEAHRLVGLGFEPKKENQCNIMLIRYLSCKKVKEWGHPLLAKTFD